ncbi:MAG TPA: 3-isopropylmalate dehydratase small subunit, partial [Firmicutes bacterium]|nr:3-isopropylmalate dehydratase small subunit [Bacillota bacterium]
MAEKLSGRAWRYGDDVDTDRIIPARYLNTFQPEELARHCLEDLDPTFAGRVERGDILVAGKNFGC